MKDFNPIKEVMTKRYEDNLIPEFVIGISNNGNEILKLVKGCNENAIFRLASMTKPITAVACLKAQEMGLLNIDDYVKKYIKGFENAKVGRIENDNIVFDHNALRDIKIRDILSHSSGIGSKEVSVKNNQTRKIPDTLEEACNDYSKWYLDFDPGTKSSYSGSNALDIVCRIIEIQSNMDYYSFLKKYILDPLNMKDTTYKLNDEQKIRLVRMHSKEKEGLIPFDFDDKYSGFINIKEGYPCGAAGLFSTYNDYFNFASMLLLKGKYKDVRILKEESIDILSTPFLKLPMEGVDDTFNWGASVFVRGRVCDTQPLEPGTYGWSGAFVSHFFVDPKNEYAVIMMTNLSNDEAAGSPNIKELERTYIKCIKGE